jgi:hypothetical protein
VEQGIRICKDKNKDPKIDREILNYGKKETNGKKKSNAMQCLAFLAEQCMSCVALYRQVQQNDIT